MSKLWPPKPEEIRGNNYCGENGHALEGGSDVDGELELGQGC